MNNLQFTRRQLQRTQESLGNQAGVKRWKIGLAEKGFPVLSDKDKAALSTVLRIPANVLLEEIKTDHFRNKEKGGVR